MTMGQNPWDPIIGGPGRERTTRFSEVVPSTSEATLFSSIQRIYTFTGRLRRSIGRMEISFPQIKRLKRCTMSVPCRKERGASQCTCLMRQLHRWAMTSSPRRWHAKTAWTAVSVVLRFRRRSTHMPQRRKGEQPQWCLHWLKAWIENHCKRDGGKDPH